MKLVAQEIYYFQNDLFFSPIRDKVDYAKVLFYTARNLLVNAKLEDVETIGELRLVVDKMSRLFFFQREKYFTLSFPFKVVIDEGSVMKITSYMGREVDSQSISAALSILEKDSFRLRPSPIDFIMNDTEIPVVGFELLEEVFASEPSYLRYDKDIKNEKGRLHPLHHIDMNYSVYGSFKLGLYDIVTPEHFVDIVTVSTDCSFFEDWR